LSREGVSFQARRIAGHTVGFDQRVPDGIARRIHPAEQHAPEEGCRQRQRGPGEPAARQCTGWRRRRRPAGKIIRSGHLQGIDPGRHFEHDFVRRGRMTAVMVIQLLAQAVHINAHGSIIGIGIGLAKDGCCNLRLCRRSGIRAAAGKEIEQVPHAARSTGNGRIAEPVDCTGIGLARPVFPPILCHRVQSLPV
jgi:hypothetical protein